MEVCDCQCGQRIKEGRHTNLVGRAESCPYLFCQLRLYLGMCEQQVRDPSERGLHCVTSGKSEKRCVVDHLTLRHPLAADIVVQRLD